MKRDLTMFAVLLLAIPALALASEGHPGHPAASGKMVFNDVAKQTAEFMGYDKILKLTAEQEKVRRTALESIPAVCCSQYSAYTCCCPCNFSKTVWGLSKYLVAKKGYNVAQVKETVQQWIHFVNPRGFTGDACFTDGGCQRPFNQNGCGGMSETEIVF
ncbi:MAG: hypothetical protein WBX15_18960 [Thermoanaerobaculia bacterium]